MKFILFAFFLSIIASISHFSLASEGEAKFIYVKGEVFISGQQRPSVKAQKGSILKPLDTITTKDDSLAVLELEDGSKIKVDPETKIKIENLIKKLPQSYNGGSHFLLQMGNIMVQAFRKISGLAPDTHRMEVKYRETILGLRGTEFFTGIEPETKDLWVSVQSGTIEAINFQDDDHEIIKPGQGFIARKGQAFTSPATYQWAQKLDWNMDIKKKLLASNFHQIKHERGLEFNKIRDRVEKRVKRHLVPRHKRLLKIKEQNELKKEDGMKIKIEDQQIKGKKIGRKDRKERRERRKIRKELDKMDQEKNGHKTRPGKHKDKDKELTEEEKKARQERREENKKKKKEIREKVKENERKVLDNQDKQKNPQKDKDQKKESPKSSDDSAK